MTSYASDFRICSYNIHKGFGVANRRFLLEDMRSAIRSVDADICFLQEVVGHQLAYGGEDHAGTESQFEFLADQTWSHFAYGKNAIAELGHHGNAILSKVPFVEWENHDISRWRFSSRGLLYGRLDNGVHLICVHLGLLEGERRYQVKRLRQLLQKHCEQNQPVIVAGDFNDWRMRVDKVMCGDLGFSEVIAEQEGLPARSFPVALPVFRVDRIYFRGLQLKEASLLRDGIWRRLSDHAAITASFHQPE
ncbi:MAG: endonuclease/exonuclease/phosphatase family protein [Halieaceae bacterium]